MEVSNVNLNKQSNLGEAKEKFAIDVLTGLCSNPKSISPMYFYDDIGSEIFQKITRHPDYYPTKTEFNILESIKNTLAKNIGVSEIDIIELGAGDGHKSQLIIEGFLDQGTKVNFYPIDISEKAMTLLEVNIKPHKNLKIHGVVGEYFQGLRFVREKSKNKQLVLFLGSNIGNFNNVNIQGFLRQLWKVLNAGDLALIGFDLKKDIAILNKAYNDAAGHTRDFNLNLLDRINSELGGNFDKNKFKHIGFYNPNLGAMESYLLSQEKQQIYISELERYFEFEPYEAIHLEYSFKFLKSDIERLAKLTGFKVSEHYTDENEYFIDSLWNVVKH